MNRRHGESYSSGRTPEYIAWTNMISRCENQNDPRYPTYGGRGIRVCARWRRDYLAFLSDVGRRPSPSHSIDRKDNDRNYEPGNVRWATELEQLRNTTKTVRVTYNGKQMSIGELAGHADAIPSTIAWRLRHGWSVEDALKKPADPSTYLYRGKRLSLRALSATTGIPRNSLLRRLKRHSSVELAISEWQKNRRGKR